MILESPYAGNIERNILYARECMRDCLQRGEAPFASHLLYTQAGVLDDGTPDERKLGVEAGFAWNTVAEKIVVYEDLGITGGMEQGIERAKNKKIPVEYRKIKFLG